MVWCVRSVTPIVPFRLFLRRPPPGGSDEGPRCRQGGEGVEHAGDDDAPTTAIFGNLHVVSPLGAVLAPVLIYAVRVAI